ncbi:hypothetical protein ACMU_09900 [Actibacterium mucosum KCTC 23349]|uniref:Uncharacterized protein n=1 Tax=Actibacterium mucosum KCTC 23349 TaxID=1454373 RepID=A0A037ZKH9_9RHOB|nr:hypothetical protein [Actibacterium mucosum]KAJ56062.1 hypothetical protein ACMU_09900 [Actibacterium mucosum KCTC 23349]
MNSEQGLLSVQRVSFVRIASGTFGTGEDAGNWNEFGIRWEDGEIAEDAVLCVTDGYYDGEDGIEFEGLTYSLEFSGDTVGDVIKRLGALPQSKRPQNHIALRYYVEFDAYFDPDVPRVGGRSSWGRRGGRPDKRDPDDFWIKWMEGQFTDKGNSDDGRG